MRPDRHDEELQVSQFAISSFRAIIFAFVFILVGTAARQAGAIGGRAESSWNLAVWLVVSTLLVVWSRRARMAAAVQYTILAFGVFSTAGFLAAWTRQWEFLDGVPLIGRGGSFNVPLRRALAAGWTCALAYLIYWLLKSVAAAHSRLEQRVQERTSQLETANRQLQEQIELATAAEAALREADRQFQQIADHLDQGVVLSVHEQDRVLFANSYLTRTWGAADLPADELLARWNTFVELGDRQRIQEQKQRSAGSGMVHEIEYRIALPRGSVHWVREKRICFVDPQGGQERLLTLLSDITEIKENEQHARELFARLAHMNRSASMGEMATALAHEVNQPLGVIANLANACRREIERGGAASPGAGETLREICQEVDRAAAVVRRLRTFVTKTPTKLEPADANRLVSEVLRLLQPELLRREVTADTLFAENLPEIHADTIQIQQVIVNLVRNAVEAISDSSPPERGVRLCTFAADGGIAIEVSNRGPKLSTACAQRMFEPYYTTKEDGLGMGLNISQSIVSHHGGSLTARPIPTGGATLRVWLPLSRTSDSHAD